MVVFLYRTYTVTRSSTSKTTPLQEVFERYLSFYAASSDHTARAKRYDIQKFLKFLSGTQKNKIPTITDWTHSNVQRFVDNLLATGESPATAARRLATIKHLGKTLAETTPEFINPAREVKAPRFQMQKPQGMTTAEIKRCKEKARERLAQKPSFNRHRNLVLFIMLLETGLRADEVRLLRMSQLTDDGHWIKDVRTKGRRYRSVYLSSRIQQELANYLGERDEVLKKRFASASGRLNKRLPVFISLYNAVPEDAESFLMGPKTLWRAINECGAGLHPHKLRHTFALELLDSSGDVRLVAQALGHADVRTTMRYTERTAQEVALAVEKKGRKKN